MSVKVESLEQLSELLESVTMEGTRLQDWRFDWAVVAVTEPVVYVDTETKGLEPTKIEELEAVMVKGYRVVGWHIRSSFERPDVDAGVDEQLDNLLEGGDMQRGFGRKWFVEKGSSLERVVFTAWMAIQQIIMHELHEAFTVEVGGKKVRLFDPHKSLEALTFGSREVV